MRTEYNEYLNHPVGWAVVNTHPHRERFALENLTRQNFCAYCPVVRRRRTRGQRATETLRPLFPSYVFVRVRLPVQRWRPLLSSYGVRSVVRCGDELSLVDDGFIRSLKTREVDGVISRPAVSWCVSQQIRLVGAFDGIVATIIEMHENDRLTVLMDLLNRPIKAKIDPSHIAPV